MLLVTVHNTLFGSQRLGAVRLRWNLGAGEVALLLGDGAQALPLTPWPLDAQGRLAAAAPASAAASSTAPASPQKP